MPEPGKAESEIKASTQQRGVYESPDKALGSEIVSVLSGKEGVVSTVHAKDARMTVDKEIFLTWKIDSLRYFSAEGGIKYLIEKDLEGGRKVVLVASFEKVEPGVESSSVSVFNVEKLILQGPKGTCVNFLERIPEGTGVKMRVGKVKKPEEAMMAHKHDYWFTPRRNEITIDSINSILDIGALWHEGGHAISYDSESEAEREIHSQARRVVMRVGKFLNEGDLYEVREEIGKIEEEEQMDYLTARLVVANEEQSASLWAINDLSSMADGLVINAEIGDQACRGFEKSLQTYDVPLIPEVAASEAAKGLSSEEADAVWHHYEEYFDLKYWLEEHGLKQGDKIYFDVPNEGRFNFSIDESGIVSARFLSQDGKKWISLAISFMGCSLSVTEKEGRSEENLFLSPKGTIEVKGIKEIVAAEKFFKESLVFALVQREKLARQDIEWIRETFKPLENLDWLDPLGRITNLLKMKGKETREALSNEIEELDKATSPLRRLDTFCLRLGLQIIRDFGLDPDIFNYKFNSKTGQGIKGEWDRLVFVCEEALAVSGTEQPVPNRYLSTEPKIEERKILEMVAEMPRKNKNKEK